MTLGNKVLLGHHAADTRRKIIYLKVVHLTSWISMYMSFACAFHVRFLLG